MDFGPFCDTDGVAMREVCLLQTVFTFFSIANLLLVTLVAMLVKLAVDQLVMLQLVRHLNGARFH